jgi:hypothetical protein
MIRIGKAKSNLRLSIGPGAWIVYREATSVDREAALHSAREFFKSVRAGAKAMSEYGFDIGSAVALDDDAGLSAGVSTLVFTVELAMRCVSAWEGVGDESGSPLPVTRENFAALLRDPVLFEVVSTALMTRVVTMDEEGNASAPSPSGAAAGASPIAGPAAN